MNDDENIPTDAEAYCETVASQEEIYLEETEEELRAILIFDPTPSQTEVDRSMSDANNDACNAESLDEQLNQAAEELITGDTDDPPLSEDTVADMLKMAQIPKVQGQF